MNWWPTAGISLLGTVVIWLSRNRPIHEARVEAEAKTLVARVNGWLLALVDILSRHRLATSFMDVDVVFDGYTHDALLSLKGKIGGGLDDFKTPEVADLAAKWSKLFGDLFENYHRIHMAVDDQDSQAYRAGAATDDELWSRVRPLRDHTIRFTSYGEWAASQLDGF